MNYIVIEMQTNNGNTSMLNYQFTSLEDALSKFFQILSVACTSTIDCHSALILDEKGFLIRNESFSHITES